LNTKKGFRRIFNALLKKKGALVGHNCIIDILFLISHFGDPLPNNIYEMKNLIRKYFPEYFQINLDYMILSSYSINTLLLKILK
jgi:hypothetical protein